MSDNVDISEQVKYLVRRLRELKLRLHGFSMEEEELHFALASSSQRLVWLEHRNAEADAALARSSERLRNLPVGNRDGNVLWSIPSFLDTSDQMLRDDINSEFVYHSNYKAQFRLFFYIKGTDRMALWMVIKKGEYDAILEWPAKPKIGVEIITALHPRNTVFQRKVEFDTAEHLALFPPETLVQPEQNENRMIGPLFDMAVRDIKDNGWLVEGALYINCNVQFVTKNLI